MLGGHRTSTLSALQTTLKEENEMALPRDMRSMAVRYGLSTMAASLALVFGSFLPLNAQPKAPEVTVANPVLKRIVQWEEYTGQFEAMRGSKFARASPGSW